MQILFLGTGSSTEVPSIRCLLREDGCLGCKSSVTTSPKNRRRQTCTLFRIPQPDDTFRNVLIDCGASSYAAMIDFFPQHNVDRIDALILTHAHNDAILGLDALTTFVTRSDLQDHLPIFCTPHVQSHVLNRATPFFAKRPDVWRFHTFQEAGDVIDLFGCRIDVLAVEHGLHSGGHTNISNGFIFDSKVVYISDVDFIPENAWQTIFERTATGSGPEILIIDCLTAFPIRGHYSLPQAVSAARRMKSKHTFLTQIAHGITHEAFEAFGASLGNGQRSQRSSNALAGAAMQDQFPRDYCDYWTCQTADGTSIALSQIPKWQSIPRGLGIDDADTNAIVDLLLQQLEEWEGGQQAPIHVRPAFDGMCVELRLRPEQSSF